MFIKLKTTLKLKNKFQLLKGKEKNFEEKRKQIIHKRRLFEWTLLFSPAFLKKIQYEQIPNKNLQCIVRISRLATVLSIC